MTKKNAEPAYEATGTLEHKRQTYRKGEVVKELSAAHVERLLEIGAIKEKK